MENTKDILGTNVNEAHKSLKEQIESERKINANVMTICLTPDGLSIKDAKNITEDLSDVLPGVYCQGVQYYDLSNVHFINNTGMAILIDLLKSLLEMGIEVQFVNVDEKIKKKINEMGLDKILNC
jgi:anti-anti-sigma factor